MGRSAQSLEQRRAYAKAWREKNKAYHKEWREKNKEKERLRIKAWRAANPDKLREQKIRYYLAHRAERISKRKPDVPIPLLHTGHELFDHAKSIVNKIIKIDTRSVIYNPNYEDAVSETVLALIEGRNPVTAAYTFKATEASWSKNVITGTSYGGLFDLTEDGKFVYDHHSYMSM